VKLHGERDWIRVPVGLEARGLNFFRGQAVVTISILNSQAVKLGDKPNVDI
jgi:hypothetical protein